MNYSSKPTSAYPPGYNPYRPLSSMPGVPSSVTTGITPTVKSPFEKPKTEEEQLEFLKAYKFYVLIDKSTSMKWEVEDGAGVSSWDVVKEYLKKIVSLTVELDRKGVEVAFFGSNVQWIEKRIEDPSQVTDVFNKIRPRGTTLMSQALKEVFDRHIKRRKSNPDEKSIVLLITDGDPDSRRNVEKSLKRMVRKIDPEGIFNTVDSKGNKRRSTLEIGVQFFRVGNQPESKKFMDHLDDDVELDVDIVDTAELESIFGRAGLLNALVNSIHD